jgi:hypothetical protein
LALTYSLLLVSEASATAAEEGGTLRGWGVACERERPLALVVVVVVVVCGQQWLA